MTEKQRLVHAALSRSDCGSGKAARKVEAAETRMWFLLLFDFKCPLLYQQNGLLYCKKRRLLVISDGNAKLRPTIDVAMMVVEIFGGHDQWRYTTLQRCADFHFFF